VLTARAGLTTLRPAGLRGALGRPRARRPAGLTTGTPLVLSLARNFFARPGKRLKRRLDEPFRRARLART
jgi:hypothetical protein